MTFHDRLPSLAVVSSSMLLAFTSIVTSLAHAEPTEAESVPVAERDRLRVDTVYRYDPISLRFFPVQADEVKAENIYSRFDARTGRHVWSLAVKGGGFRHALGPGSTQTADRFDIRATDAEKRARLESQAPEAAKLLAVQGTKPSLHVDGEGRWALHVGPTVRQVFDESNGLRWEWHGDRPTKVVHAYGDTWFWDRGRYRPVTLDGEMIVVTPGVDDWH